MLLYQKYARKVMIITRMALTFIISEGGEIHEKCSLVTDFKSQRGHLFAIGVPINLLLASLLSFSTKLTSSTY